MLTSPLRSGTRRARGIPWRRRSEPGLVFNIEADPAVDVEIDGRDVPMRARVPTPRSGELWSAIVAAHDNYAAYQEKTERRIPVVVLDPR